MTESTEPVRAPQDAVAWTATEGWIYDLSDLPVDPGGHPPWIVTEGEIRDIPVTAMAPLVTAIRIDADITELISRVEEVDELRLKMLSAAEGLAQALSEPAAADE